MEREGSGINPDGSNDQLPAAMSCSKLTDDLCREISAYMDNACQREDVANLTTLSHALQTAFDRALRALNERINTMARVNRLPDDVLILIFRVALEPYPLSTSGYPAPQAVAAQVCRRWRQVVISDARCWADISVNLSHNGCSSALSALLERTRSHRVNVTARESRFYGHTQDMRLSTEAIRPHLGRVQSLIVNTSGRGDCAFLDLLELPVPHLQRLTVELTRVSNPVACEGFLSDSSELEYLTVSFVSLDRHAWRFPLLQHVDISSECHPGLICTILGSCPVLLSLRIFELPGGMADVWPETDVAIHACLEKLELVDVSEDSIICALRRVRVQTMQSIDITGRNVANSPIPSMIFPPRRTADDRLSLSFPTLKFCVEVSAPGRCTRLTGRGVFPSMQSMLHGISLRVEHATHVSLRRDLLHFLVNLEAMSCLIDLEVHAASYALMGSATLQNAYPAPLLCPNLESLSFKTTHQSQSPPATDAATIVELIENKLQFQRPRLRHLRLDVFSRSCEAVFAEVLRDLADTVSIQVFLS